MPLQTVEMDRRRMRNHTDCRYVQPQEFYSLLLSRRRLERADDPEALLRGVKDPATGTRFFIEAAKLANWTDG